jgi:hypothetical protein
MVSFPQVSEEEASLFWALVSSISVVMSATVFHPYPKIEITGTLEGLPNLYDFRPEVPDKLIAVIGKALAKKASDRYNTIADLARDLGRVQEWLKGGCVLTSPLLRWLQSYQQPSCHNA